ncbi:MAG: zinc-dependent peptidase [Chitinophagaceae bacterium]
MPQDSTNILLQTRDTPPIGLQDTLHHATLSHTVALQAENGDLKMPSAGTLLVFMLIIFCTVMVLYWLPVFSKRVMNLVRDKVLYRRARRLYWLGHAKYDDILRQYMPYYRQLAVEQQELFLHRTLVFMSAKEFRFNNIEREERIPLLISAAAVQLTFGLDNYLLDHFTTIYILPNKYQYAGSEVPFQGHVSEEGVFFSWENFLASFANYNDGDNVGLHEWAHALAYVNIISDESEDNGFRKRFMVFTRTGRKVFEEIQLRGNYLLGSYAATNYNEFWAVSVEKFFEQPQAFRALLPELYRSMCVLLNQDPLSESILLEPIEEVYNQ